MGRLAVPETGDPSLHAKNSEVQYSNGQNRSSGKALCGYALWLIANGGAVITRVGGATTFACFRVDTDGVDQSDVTSTFHHVSALFYLLFHLGRKDLFHSDDVREPLVMKAWGVDGGLRVHLQAHPVQNRQKCGGDNGWPAW